MRVRIHIDHVVLHGLAAVDRPRFQAAFEVELARLITTNGVPARMEMTWRADAVSMTPGMPPAASAEAGRWLAQRLYGAFV